MGYLLSEFNAVTAVKFRLIIWGGSVVGISIC
jgi:hypothetical protein